MNKLLMMRNAIVKNGPSILTGIGVVGVIATAVTASKATLIASEVIAEEEEHTQQELDTKEKVALTWKYYIPTIVVGALTISSIVGSNKINLKRNAALAGLYSLSQKSFDTYKKKVVQKIGEEKEKEVKQEVNEDKVARHYKESDVIYTGHGDTLFWDSTAGRAFKSDMDTVKRACIDLSREMISCHSVTLNELYYKLNLPDTSTGEMLGWHIDQSTVEPEFDSMLTPDGKACVVMGFKVEPLYHDMYGVRL